jgi:AraC family transcriptional regulator, transcriptional activator of pobA
MNVNIWDDGERLSFVPRCMRKYRPLLIQKLNLQLSGLKVMRLSLNRHFPENEQVQLHLHPFSQSLLYLTGGGVQKVQDRSHLIRPGTLVLIPSNRRHAFQRVHQRRPLCLVLDFQWRAMGKQNVTVVQLTHSDLAQVRRLLSGLASLSDEADGPQTQTAALVLQIMDVFLKAAGWLTREQQPSVPVIVRKVEKVLNEPGMLQRPLTEVAGKVGYQMDYLNRVLRQSAGLTLGQVRSQRLLELAKAGLNQSTSIQEVAARLDFSDQNYFARWFRQQTGYSPSQWRRGA